MMDLSIIIINWNSADFVEKCVHSIIKQIKNLRYEIIVVDNASYDSCRLLLAKKFPEVIFIQSSENLGFAKANNLGYAASSGKLLLFLNPDTEIVDKAIEKMALVLSERRENGIVGCKLLNSDRTIQTSCVQSFPTILNQILDSDVLRSLFPRSRLWGNRVLLKKCRSPQEVDVVSGACLMIKRCVFDQIGLFSNEYFMYSEDVDLCYKARKAGYTVLYTDFGTVIHHSGQSTKRSKKTYASAVLMQESRYRFFKKTKGLCYAIVYRVGMTLKGTVRLLCCAFAAIFRMAGLGNSDIRNMFGKWCSILLWALKLDSEEDVSNISVQIPWIKVNKKGEIQ